MKLRKLGKTGIQVSEVSLGTWQVGGRWGSKFEEANAEKILNTAIDSGINFFDTADIYNNGKSESVIGKVLRSRSEKVYLATKCGQKLQPHTHKNYTAKALRKFVEDSLKNTGIDCLDLIQLHCPPVEVYYRPEVFRIFDDLKAEGKISHFGVSVQKIEEALKAIEYENVETVQIVFNMFRQRPLDLFFKRAKEKNTGIIARVPLASGLLTGTYYNHKKFSSGDHRNFNRKGEFFDKGETFSGIDYTLGLEAVEKLKAIFPNIDNLAPFAIRWILMFPEISCVIPGASRVEQLKQNLIAINLDPLTNHQMKEIKEVYNTCIRPHVHHLW